MQHNAKSLQSGPQLFTTLLRLFQLNQQPDWNSITTVWVQSNDLDGCAEALAKLISDGASADAYQIGFDLVEVASQNFVERVRTRIASTGGGQPAVLVCDLIHVVICTYTTP